VILNYIHFPLSHLVSSPPAGTISAVKGELCVGFLCQATRLYTLYCSDGDATFDCEVM